MSMHYSATVPVASLEADRRVAFMGRVYQNLGLAFAAFVGIEVLLFATGAAEGLYDFLAGSSMGWLLILGGFMIGNWFATNAAHDLGDPGRQYLGLFGSAAAESLIFAPFLYYVFNYGGGSVTVGAAGILTGVGFAGLSVVGLTTAKDLSFMRPLLMWSGIVALVLVLGAVVFGLELGVWFSVAMIAVAGGSILYKTQEILRSYPEEAAVGAAVQLFASLMLLLWYVLRLLSRR
jgi:FtsH-binding integral membrane protein